MSEENNKAIIKFHFIRMIICFLIIFIYIVLAYYLYVINNFSSFLVSLYMKTNVLCNLQMYIHLIYSINSYLFTFIIFPRTPTMTKKFNQKQSLMLKKILLKQKLFRYMTKYQRQMIEYH